MSRTETVVITPKGKTLAINLHVASHTVHITVDVLHNAMKWEGFESIVGDWKSWNSTFLETRENTPTDHTSQCIHIIHLTFQSIFLKALLLMETEQL
jgi:hypothetical protein